MPRTFLYKSVLLSLSALCVSCGGVTQTSNEAQPMTQKQRWYWLGSTSYAGHNRPGKPENYWLEIDGERAQLQADCNSANAKAATTHEGRLWITNIASTKTGCGTGSLGTTFIKQLGQTLITEQRGQVLRIPLSQYGDAMFFALEPTARFASYRCDGGESMAVIALARNTHIWLGDQYSQAAGDNYAPPKGDDTREALSHNDSIDASPANCRKLTAPGN